MNTEKQTVSDIGVTNVGVKNMDYKIVGYLSKAGKLGTYKHTATAKNKFGAGNRVKLVSFGSCPVEFWIDENKLVDAPPPKSAEVSGAAENRQCWECGGFFTYRDAKEHGGEWSEDYCGC